MNRLVYLTRNYKSVRYGGGKARVDAEDILADMGAVNLGLARTFHRNMVVDYFRNLVGIAHYVLFVRRGDVVVLQYPVKKYYRFLCFWAKMRGAKTVTLIHDLGSFRRKRLTVDEEIKKLSLTDVAIAANENTVKWLSDKGLAIPITTQIAWDYLCDRCPSGRVQAPLSCLFVGQAKESVNGFLYRMPKELEVYLYGAGAPQETAGHIHAYGHVMPDSIISEGKGRYGIIWYGSTLDYDDKGYIGEYIAYCNPHKLGLYMRAEKPVVIWKGAGAAAFVEQEGIGITVDSLKDLDKMLKEVTDERYEEMVRNVRRIGSLMAGGYFLREAVMRSLRLLGVSMTK